MWFLWLPSEGESSSNVVENCGRDTSSVFPNHATEQQAVEVEELKLAIGASRFVSEAQLEEIGTQKREAHESLPMVPLAEVLADNKRKKEEEFQEQWRQMKQGKNRPLDPDEFEFVESLRLQESAQYLRMREEEERELQAFQNAVENPEDAIIPQLKVKKTCENLKLRDKAGQPLMKKSVRVKIVRKGTSNKSPVQKKLKTCETSTAKDNTGLSGLLGDYGSDISD